jgi:DNA-binding GntR family transcriptional regulator
MPSALPFPPPRRRSGAAGAAAAALRTLRGLIAAGALPPGAPLIELELSGRLGVSRPTLREALRLLQSEGLAEASRARGLAVRRLTRRDVADLYQIREALEALAARAAAQREREGHTRRDTWREQRRLWQQAAASGELVAFSEANRRLHALVLEASGNVHLPQALDRTLIDLFAAQLRGFIAPPSVLQSARQHLRLIDAIAAGDAPAAEQAMREHVRASAATILALPDAAF